MLRIPFRSERARTLSRLPRARFRAGGLLASTFAVFLASPVAAQSIAIAPAYEAAGEFHEGMAPAKRDGRWGFIAWLGEEDIPPAFEAVQPGSEGRFAVRRDGLWGYFASDGKMAIEPAFEEAGPFSDGVAAVSQGGRFGYVGPTGRTVIGPVFEAATAREAGFAAVREDGRWGVLGPEGTSVPFEVPEGARIESAGAFSDGRSILVTDAGSFVADTQGRLRSQAFRDIRPFAEGLAAATRDGTDWVFIDRDGAVAIGGPFEGADAFSGGYAPAARDGAWGFVGRDGAFLAPPAYEGAEPFHDGYALVRQSGKVGFVGVTADGALVEVVAPDTYDDALAVSEDMAPVKDGEAWGYLLMSDTSLSDAWEDGDVEGDTDSGTDADDPPPVVVVRPAGDDTVELEP